MDGTEIWDKLHWFNFPDLEPRDVSYDEHLSKRLIPSINNNNNKPFYVYLYNGDITKLKEINHSKETVEYLNDIGVTFYLNEPLCQYHTMTQPSFQYFYTELTGKEDPKDLRARELDSILKYVIKHGLTNVKVKTCDYDVDKHFPYYNQWMTLLCEDTFVKNALIVNVHDDSFSSDFTKKFINLNWRWTPHRNLAAAYLAQESSYVSYCYKSDFAYLNEHSWLNIESWPEKYKDKIFSGSKYIDEHGPLVVDTKIRESVEPKSNLYPYGDMTVYESFDPMHGNPVEKYYRDVFCDIVTESRFAQPTANYSEKVHQPMFYKKPFVLLAPPHTLKYLKEQGYKTFSDYWDESYDSCEDHKERIFKIFDVIDYINAKSIDEIKEMYKNMKSILKHNFLQVQENIYSWY